MIQSLDFDPHFKVYTALVGKSFAALCIFNFEEKPMFEALLSNRTVGITVMQCDVTASLWDRINAEWLPLFFAAIVL